LAFPVVWARAIPPSAASTHGASALNLFDEVLRWLR
jgi:hypothetical protein